MNTAIVVEVKSHARQESIGQLITHLQRFREFFLSMETKNSMASSPP
ncbi:hypothetical protein NON20_01415 [Synechocystis sp. B12]|nr:hypothetical protein NON20_01415 [Synechocystis sp. B12]